MRVALCLGGGEVGVTRSFLGVRGELAGAIGKTDGGVVGREGGSNIDCTSSALLLEGVGEGARGTETVIGGCAAGLGAATTGKEGSGVGTVSTPEEVMCGKLLSSKVTSLDNL